MTPAPSFTRARSQRDAVTEMRVAALYQFCRVADPVGLQCALQPLAAEAGLRGTLILAGEGINGTIAGEDRRLRRFVAALQAGVAPGPAFGRLNLKWSGAEALPFGRLKIKVKREIVTLAAPEADPAARVGTYVAPADWNDLLAEPDLVLIDTRNHFEVGYGTFPGAVDPGTARFSEFPAFVAQHLDPVQHRRVAMFCTGGIRCEKASALLLARGFESVFHLEGGILAYLEQVPAERQLWQGRCFVFDGREALAAAQLQARSGPDGEESR